MLKVRLRALLLVLGVPLLALAVLSVADSGPAAAHQVKNAGAHDGIVGAEGLGHPPANDDAHAVVPSAVGVKRWPLPERVAEDDDLPVELGLRFSARVAGEVTGLRMYRGSRKLGSHLRGRLWSADGALLATATFSSRRGLGWRVAELDEPVSLEAGASYVVSYFAPNGRYPVTERYFTEPMQAPWADLPEDAGVFSYGRTAGPPTETYRASNYFVDVLFTPGDVSTMSPSKPEPTELPPSGGPEISVSGNRLVDEQGESVVLHGVNKSGSEYACIDGWGFFDGPVDEASIAAMKSWGVNSVRVPLNSACWLDLPDQFANYSAAYSGASYQKAISDYVDLLASNGLYTILDLHWTGCGDGTCLANWLKPMPERAHAIDFWSSVATTFNDNRSVLFDLFNEPQSVDWECWESGGCTAFEGDAGNEFVTEGMQPMVTAVREAGATEQPLLLGGLHYANDMRGWQEHLPVDPSDSLVASVHLYDFNYPCPAIVDGESPAAAAILCLTGERYNSLEDIASEHPVVFGELGQGDCRTDFVLPMLRWMEESGYSSLGWAWNTADCASFPALISDYDGTPTEFGKAFLDFYTGGSPEPTVTPRPTAPSGEADGMPMISRGAPAFASSGVAANASDETYDSVWQPTGREDWIAFDLSSVGGQDLDSVVVAWYTSPDDGYSVSPLTGVCAVWSGRPYLSDYTIEANSGPGGTEAPSEGWVPLASVQGNTNLSGQQQVDFTGYNWIRLRGSGPNGVGINVDVVDASRGVSDGWLFLGDSITALYAGHGSGTDPSGRTVGSFTELVSAGTDGQRRPISQNAATSCARSWDAFSWLDSMLAAFRGRYVTLNFGTNDGWGASGNPSSYYDRMEALVAKVEAEGKVAVVATIPWPNNPGGWAANTERMNEQITRLYAEHPGVVRGPDLYTLLEDRPELFRGHGDVHPNETGAAVIRQAWGEAMLSAVYGRSSE